MNASTLMTIENINAIGQKKTDVSGKRTVARMNRILIDLQCSNCGKFERNVSNEKVENAVKVIKKGWNSFGSALYCPECSVKFEKRNGKPLSGEKNTFFVIMQHFLNSYKGGDSDG